MLKYQNQYKLLFNEYRGFLMPLFPVFILFALFLSNPLGAMDQYALHKTIAKYKKDTALIVKLAAQGHNPNLCDPSGADVWQIIESRPFKGHTKKSLRYAINIGLRSFFQSHPDQIANFLGDCGNPQCDVAQIALNLSIPSNTKNREKILCTVYDTLNDRLKKNACKNLERHTIEGLSLRQAILTGYCCSYYRSSKKSVDEIDNKRSRLIKLYRRQLENLLTRYPSVTSLSLKKRKFVRANHSFIPNKDLCSLPANLLEEEKVSYNLDSAEDTEQEPESADGYQTDGVLQRNYFKSEEDEPFDLDRFFFNKLD